MQLPSLANPLLMFLSLFALYSPLAAVSSYFPTVAKLNPSSRDAWPGVFMYVSIFALVALWIGEPLLELLGVTTAALTATGGVALLYAGIPLMRGVEEAPAAEAQEKAEAEGPKALAAAERSGGGPVKDEGWRKVLFMPVTFPLTVGGTTFAILVSFRADAGGLPTSSRSPSRGCLRHGHGPHGVRLRASGEARVAEDADRPRARRGNPPDGHRGHAPRERRDTHGRGCDGDAARRGDRDRELDDVVEAYATPAAVALPCRRCAGEVASFAQREGGTLGGRTWTSSVAETEAAPRSGS